MKKVQILTFLLCAVYVVSAQTSPGGVSTNLQLWVRANSGTSTTGSLVDTWSYVNNGNSFTSAGGARPTLISSGLNFGPTVRFLTGGPLVYMDGPTNLNAPIAAGDDDYTLFAVWQSNTTSAFQRIWSQRTNCGNCLDAFSLSTWDGSFPGVGYGDEAAIAPFYHTVSRPFTAGPWNISQINLLNQASSDLEIVDDRNISTGALVINTDPGGSPNGAGLRAIGTQFNRMGLSWDNTGQLDGDIAELIVYDRPISGAERNNVFSYLALKYGITIKTDLLASTGTVVWNSTANSTYNNAVFGLSRDNGAIGSGLSVSQSNSVLTGSGTGTGQSGKGNIVLSSPSSLDNLDFLQIGNDNAALTEITTDLPTTAAGSKRYTREWKVQHTGNVGTVSLSFDFTGLSTSGSIGNTGDFRLMVDPDGDGDFTNGIVRYYSPVSFTGNVANFTNVTLNDNEVFAVITKTNAFLLPVSWTDFTVTLNNKEAYLHWSIENNSAASLYEIEHSADGINFEKVGATANNASIKNYSFVHKGLLSGTHYYRIRELDLNGKITYSKIISVSVKAADFVIYLSSNPVQKNYAEAVVNAAVSGKALVELWSVNGTRSYSQSQQLTTGTNNIRIPMDKAAPGNYLLKITVNDVTQSMQFVKL